MYAITITFRKRMAAQGGWTWFCIETTDAFLADQRKSNSHDCYQAMEPNTCRSNIWLIITIASVVSTVAAVVSVGTRIAILRILQVPVTSCIVVSILPFRVV